MSATLVETHYSPVVLPLFPECKFTTVSLEISRGMKFERWLELGEFLRAAGKGIQFWIGDWVRFGEHEYGEMYAQAIDATGREEATLQNWVFVAQNVHSSRRRELDVVDFSTHAEVASLPPDDQERILAQAEEEQSTVREVRREVQRTKRLRVSQGVKRTPKAAQADVELQAHIERVILKIENEIKPDCPDTDFIRRHYDSWLDDLRFELNERAIVETQEKILEAWEYGNRTDEELRKATGFTKGVVGQILGRLGWEKVRQGGKTDAARGDRPWIWHKPGEAMGSDAQIPRTVYEMGDVGDK